MKRGIAILAVLYLTTCSRCHELDVFSNTATDFSVKLLMTLVNNTAENVIISPTSIHILLSLLQQGAKGETAEQLKKLINLNPEDSRNSFDVFLRSGLASDESVTHVMGTKIYVKPGSAVSADFLKTAEVHFKTQVEEINLTADDTPTKINDWVSNATDGHIQDLITPGALSSTSVMVLISAVFFSGKWLHPFKTVKENDRFFVTRKKSFPVDMFEDTMELRADHEKDLNIKWIELPYQGDKYSMYLVLPSNRLKMHTITDKINGNTLRRMMDSKSTKKVHFRVPRCSVKRRSSLQEPLEQMGLEAIFDRWSDLSGIGEGLRVTDFVHEASLVISENGTTAAAATGVVINMLSLTWDPTGMDFFADQPYLAFLVDNVARVPIFASKIVDPRG